MIANEKITSYRVILISSNGENKGEFLKSNALQMAFNEGLDLVQVGLKNGIPICKIMDYGKAQYEKQKQEKHQKKSPQLKSVRFSYNIEQHDIDIKKKQIDDFLSKGHKVTLNMDVKGREKVIGAKDKFHNLVLLFDPLVKISDIKEHLKGYNYTLVPNRK